LVVNATGSLECLSCHREHDGAAVDVKAAAALPVPGVTSIPLSERSPSIWSRSCSASSPYGIFLGGSSIITNISF
jgi:hypothetical protein